MDLSLIHHRQTITQAAVGTATTNNQPAHQFRGFSRLVYGRLVDRPIAIKLPTTTTTKTPRKNRSATQSLRHHTKRTHLGRNIYYCPVRAVWAHLYICPLLEIWVYTHVCLCSKFKSDLNRLSAVVERALDRYQPNGRLVFLFLSQSGLSATPLAQEFAHPEAYT